MVEIVNCPHLCYQKAKTQKALRSIGTLNANKVWDLIEKSAVEEKIKIYMLTPSLIIISLNDNYMNKEKNYDSVKYQLFSVAFSEEGQGKL